MMKIGIISDTHDLIRPEVAEHLQGCDCILHGGDICSQRILDQLERLAPVKAVRGNNDREWAGHLPPCLDFDLGGLRVYMTHKKKDLPRDLNAYDLVIYGHSHQYAEAWLAQADGHRTLLLNPGSCGARRFHQPVTMALMLMDDEGWQVKRIQIQQSPREAGLGLDTGDVRRQIELVVKETRKGQSVSAIAGRHGLEEELVEQIARLYVTHPGVTVDGIMAKMGL